MKPSLPSHSPAVGIAVLCVAAVVLSGCQSTATSAGDGAIAVTSTDDRCDVASAEAPSGAIQFAVKNGGSQVTEFYVLAADGLQVLGEVENIGPGLSRDLVVQVPAGTYRLACKPGMVGDGIRSDFTVTDSGNASVLSATDQQMVDTATSQYASYVKDQTEQLLAKTKTFAAAFAAGDDDSARSLFAPARMHWERIEPVAESFGDLDPKLDLREADLEAGQEWTGWHRTEKELWPPASGYVAMTQAERQQVADQLVTDTQTLYDRTRDLTYTAAQLGNGAKELLDEVATGKVTGEEEFWSHTDLWDFQGNLDGAKVAYAGLRPLVLAKDPELAKTLDTEFANVQALLDKYRHGDGWVYYTDLTPEQIKELAAAVDALGEPLSMLTSAVVL